MTFADRRSQIEAELEAFYAGYPADVSGIERELDALADAHPEWSSCRLKAALWETAAQRCDVHVFRHFPFFFEAASGRCRDQWGMGGLGTWLMRRPGNREHTVRGDSWKRRYDPFVIFNGRNDIDLDHHCVGYDHLLQTGLGGIIRAAEARLAGENGERERDFLESAIRADRAVIALAERFAGEAERLLATEADPEAAANLGRIAAAARRVPRDPPETFHQALNAILFVREAVGSFEGVGVSTFGMLDRMLDPFYRRDVERGILTRQEAKDLLCAFLAYTDVKFAVGRDFSASPNPGHDHVETSTTVFIGGCDRDGTPVFNDVTRMILEAYTELRLLNPKFQARFAPGHPDEYYRLVSRCIGAGTNVLAVYNDDVIIRANVREGKRLEDARLYVGGGCQENILQNTEINSRATLFFNLLAVFEMSLFPGRRIAFAEAEGVSLRDFSDCSDFDSFYAAYFGNLRTVVTRMIEHRNIGEAEGGRFNPCPVLSSTIADCIATGRDMTEGGARYSFASVDPAGIGTLIDSLYAVREVVFRQGALPLSQLRDMLETNFEGEEAFRSFLVNRIPKFGRDEADMRAFSARVFGDVAAAMSGMPNARGGRYSASLFAHRSFTGFGNRTGATPDGRRAGEYLSPGLGPSVLSLGSKADVGAVLDSLAPVDLTDYPVVGVLDLKLPAECRRQDSAPVEAVIRRFLAAGGAVMQINVVDPALLLEAKAHPERHPDLVVRISGYSAYFSRLPDAVKDEVILRTLAV